MRSPIVGAFFLAGHALAGPLPMPMQTLAADNAKVSADTAAAPAQFKRSLSSATATANVRRQESTSQSPIPTASDCSLVTAEPTSWTTTLPGTAVGQSITTTQSVAGGPGCECANGVIAGLMTSIGNDGHTSVYCATASYYSTGAVSTAVETSNPGNPNNGAWAQVSCEYGSLTSIDNNPWAQWNDSGANAAYQDVKAAWESRPVWEIPKEDNSFPDFMCDFFHARPDISCDVLDNSNCEVTINCGEGLNEPNAPVSAPAGYVIINSLIALHQMYENIYNGINDALPQVLADVGHYVDTLSPIVEDIKEQQQSKLILDGVQMGLIFVTAPFLHSFLMRFDPIALNPNWFGTGVDVTYGVIGTSMAFAKDAMEALSPLPVQNEMSSYFGNTTQQWLTTLADMNRNIMNDPDALHKIIDRGRLFVGQVDDNPVSMINVMKKTLFATGIRAVWMSGEDVTYPVIVRDIGMPQKGSGCQSYNPNNWEGSDQQTATFDLDGGEETGSATRICDGDHAFFLMGANPDSDKTVCQGPDINFDTLQPCTMKSVKFSKLRGWDDLNGDNFGGLTKEDVAWNAINMWKSAGEKNAFSSTWDGADSPEAIEAIVSGDLKRTKGIVNIPVCSIQEIFDTISAEGEGADDNPNYPCPR